MRRFRIALVPIGFLLGACSLSTGFFDYGFASDAGVVGTDGAVDAGFLDTGLDGAADDARVLCGADERVESNRCVGCAPGTSNDAGDDPVGDDTTCTAVLCEADQRVEADACVPCGPREMNDAGDDASGEDTSCDDACFQILGLDCESFATSYLKADNRELGDRFGASVAIDGDTIAVGAPYEDGVGAEDGGAVYIFVREESGWVQEAYLVADNPGVGDRFGEQLALDDDTLAVGVRYEDSDSRTIDGLRNDAARNAGAVYVYRRAAEGWRQEAFVKAANADVGDAFGGSVALSGDTLAVGAVGEDGANNPNNNSRAESGAVYVFVRDDSGWFQQARIKGPSIDAGDSFGVAVSLSVDTLAIGADGEDSNATTIGGDPGNDGAGESGAAFIFVRSGTRWLQEAYIKASNGEPGDRFGRVLDLHLDTLVVASPEEDGAEPGVSGPDEANERADSGAVYVFVRAVSGTWSQQAYLKAALPTELQDFGRAVSIDGDVLAVGADDGSSATNLGGDQEDFGAPGSGAVYLFIRSSGAWSFRAYLKASNTDAGDGFGAAVDLQGTTLVVGARFEDSDGSEADNGLMDSGATYVRDLGTGL